MQETPLLDEFDYERFSKAYANMKSRVVTDDLTVRGLEQELQRERQTHKLSLPILGFIQKLFKRFFGVKR